MVLFLPLYDKLEKRGFHRISEASGTCLCETSCCKLSWAALHAQRKKGIDIEVRHMLREQQGQVSIST